MQLALVVGWATSTLKDKSLPGQKLVVVQPLMANEREPDGYPLLAIDAVGCGQGDKVLLTSDGRAARELLQAERTPVRWTIVGIRD